MNGTCTENGLKHKCFSITDKGSVSESEASSERAGEALWSEPMKSEKTGFITNAEAKFLGAAGGKGKSAVVL